MLTKKKKIGQILLDNNFITKAVLNEALSSHAKAGLTLTEYLIIKGHINEKDLTQALVEQFRFPYMPVGSYKIADEVIKIVPPWLARKHSLIPINQVDDTLTVVMADPFDLEAHSDIKKATGCGIHPFIGIFSEIQEALHKYYHFEIRKPEPENAKKPSYISARSYVGVDRRKTIRYDAEIEAYFSTVSRYKKADIVNFSLGGVLLTSKAAPSGSHTIVQIERSEKWDPDPMLIVGKTVRLLRHGQKHFEFAIKFEEVIHGNLQAIHRYMEWRNSCVNDKKLACVA
jgi:hypothetical protein